MKGIILHGGHGSRLRPLTHTAPKQLIPIANKPISQYVLEDLVQAGVKQIAIVLGDLYPEKVKQYYGNGHSFNSKIRYILQSRPKGIAHAISLCQKYVGENPFVVYLGDNLLKGGTKDFAENFKSSNYDAMILLCKVENPCLFGVAKFGENGKLTRLIEKPKQPPSNYALTGIYFFKPIIFEMIKMLKPSWRGELEITEAIQLLIDKGYNVGHQFVKSWWKDTGAPEDILDANRLVLDELDTQIKGKIEVNSCIQGRVFVGENAIVKHGSVVRGPTVIGSNSIIENDAYVGPYTSIGNCVTIRHGEIENSIVMDNCLIDIDDRIADSLIGPGSIITSNRNNKPKARRFLLGEKSQITL
jgi:glucose-1-phosphate thymidylyltransferase